MTFTITDPRGLIASNTARINRAVIYINRLVTTSGSGVMEIVTTVQPMYTSVVNTDANH